MEVDSCRQERYHQVDFIRGIALLLMFYNHLVFLSGLGIRAHYGFSDSAAVFVFLSGFVSGVVYGRAYLNTGFAACARKSTRRALQLYGAHILTLIPVLLLASLLALPGDRVNELSKLTPLFVDPWPELWKFLCLKSAPWYFDILPMYVIFLFFLPVMIWGLHRQPWAVISVSAFLYLAVQWERALGIEPVFAEWVFNPLCWQLLYVAGAFFSTKRGQDAIVVVGQKPVLYASILLVIYALIDIGYVRSFLHLDRFGSTRVLLPWPFPYTEKRILEPVVLVHFAAVAIIGRFLVGKVRDILAHPLTRGVARLGRHSLLIFCASIVLDYLFSYLLSMLGGGAGMFALSAAIGCAILAGISLPLDALTTRRLYQGA